VNGITVPGAFFVSPAKSGATDFVDPLLPNHRDFLDDRDTQFPGLRGIWGTNQLMGIWLVKASVRRSHGL